jgi:hypothetical protein
MTLLKEKINSDYGVVLEHDRSHLSVEKQKIRTFEAQDGRVICFDPAVSTYKYFRMSTGISLKPSKPPRDIQENLYNGKFTSVPGDVYTIERTRGMLSSNVSIHVTNDGTMNAEAILTDEYFNLPNNLDAWKFLKQINEIAGRVVFEKIGDEPAVKYEKSGPYRYRFGT